MLELDGGGVAAPSCNRSGSARLASQRNPPGWIGFRSHSCLRWAVRALPDSGSVRISTYFFFDQNTIPSLLREFKRQRGPGCRNLEVRPKGLSRTGFRRWVLVVRGLWSRSAKSKQGFPQGIESSKKLSLLRGENHY